MASSVNSAVPIAAATQGMHLGRGTSSRNISRLFFFYAWCGVGIATGARSGQSPFRCLRNARRSSLITSWPSTGLRPRCTRNRRSKRLSPRPSAPALRDAAALAILKEIRSGGSPRYFRTRGGRLQQYWGPNSGYTGSFRSQALFFRVPKHSSCGKPLCNLISCGLSYLW